MFAGIRGLKTDTPYINTKNIIKDGKVYEPGQACYEFYPGIVAHPTATVSTQYKLNDGKKCQHLALGREKSVSCSEFRDYFYKQYGAVDFFLQKYTVHKEGKIYPKEPEKAPLYPAPICPPPTPCQCICTGS